MEETYAVYITIVDNSERTCHLLLEADGIEGEGLVVVGVKVQVVWWNFVYYLILFTINFNMIS